MTEADEPSKTEAPVPPSAPGPHVTHRWNRLSVLVAAAGLIAMIVFGVLQFLHPAPAPPPVIVPGQTVLMPAAPAQSADPLAPAILRFRPPVFPGTTITLTFTSATKQGEPSATTGEPVFQNSVFDFTLLLRTAAEDKPGLAYVERYRRGMQGKEDRSLEGATVEPAATSFNIYSTAPDRITAEAQAWILGFLTRDESAGGSAVPFDNLFDPGVPVTKGSRWSARPEALAHFLAPMGVERGDVDLARTMADFSITAMDPRTATFRGKLLLVMKTLVVAGKRVPVKNVSYSFDIGGEVSTASGTWGGFEVTMDNALMMPFSNTAYSSEVHMTIGVRPGGNIPVPEGK